MERARISLKAVLGLARESAAGWIADRAPRKGAALAFYMLFSLAPILIIAINIAALFFGAEAARGEVVAQIGSLIGEQGALAVQGMIDDAAKSHGGFTAAAIGIATLLVGATSALAELKDGLDQIWAVPPERTKGFGYLIRSRLLSLGFILTLAFLLLVSLVFSAAFSALSKRLDSGAMTPMLLEGLNLVVSYALVTALFAAIYKVLPSVKIAWRDVLAGAAVTAALFAGGKLLIGLYLGNGAIASAYGAAGSIIILLMWVYFSALIFLLGAEFTKFYTYRYGSRRGKHEAPRVLGTAAVSR